MATINEAIQVYWLHRSIAFRTELNNLFKKHHHPKTITHNMAIDIFEGDHQSRLPYEISIKYSETIKFLSKALRSSVLMTYSYSDFEDLYDSVKRCLHSVPGVGSLTYYDIALRIGFIRERQILPQKKVYLSHGALKGANNLRKSMPTLFSPLPSNLLNRKGELKEYAYDISIFDPALQEMTSPFLEDFFCVFDRELIKLPSLTYQQLQKAEYFYDRCIHI